MIGNKTVPVKSLYSPVHCFLSLSLFFLDLDQGRATQRESRRKMKTLFVVGMKNFVRGFMMTKVDEKQSKANMINQMSH